ncbi:MAG: type 4a pilus biogenesis protein PilO [Candidatus Kerfeldbacteria bacterium]|nr:type 4a pilus biogenesis protein PilO [Candidatus Kerfeldbacteria bacterium]
MTGSQRYLAIQISWLLGGLVIGGLVLSYLSGRLNRMSDEMSKQRTLMEVLTTRENITASLRAEAQILVDDLKIIRQAVPSSDDLTSVVSSLESAAAQNNLVQVLNFASLSEGATGIVPLGFQASLTGNLDNFTAYLGKLEKLPYVIQIQNVDLTGGSQGYAAQGQFQLSGRVYVRNSP